MANIELIDASIPLEAEAYYIEQLVMLQRSYQRDAEPIIKQLVKLRALRTPKYIMRVQPDSEQPTNNQPNEGEL